MRRLAVSLFLLLAFLGTSASAGPSAHPSECSDFSTQAEAQTYFDAQGEDYLNLDADGNGIACDQPGDYGQSGPSAHSTECSDFNTQAEAQEAFDNHAYDDTNFDADGNGIACDEEGAFNLPETSSSETTNDADVAVAGLPSTGSGAVNQQEDHAAMLALTAVILLAGSAVITRRMTA